MVHSDVWGELHLQVFEGFWVFLVAELAELDERGGAAIAVRGSIGSAYSKVSQFGGLPEVLGEVVAGRLVAFTALES
jgi:hypothetical protein